MLPRGLSVTRGIKCYQGDTMLPGGFSVIIPGGLSVTRGI